MPEPTRPSRSRVRSLELVALAILAVVLIALVLVESGLIPHESPPATPPRVQQLTAPGENWTMLDTSPHVVTVTVEGSITIWSNFTVYGGGVSIFVCNASAAIDGASFPACNPTLGAIGGAEHASGVLFNFTDLPEMSVEMVFVNYGPPSGSDTIAYLVWSTALTVETD